MDDFKTYIIRIVIVALIVQLGVIFCGEKYKRIYSLIGAIFVVFSLLSFPEFDFNDVLYNEVKPLEYEGRTISERFTADVSQKIKNEVMDVFKKEAEVSVLTDSSYSKICITVRCKCTDEEKFRIEEYVAKTFCTPEDEVVVVSE